MRAVLPTLILAVAPAHPAVADCSNPQNQAEISDCAYEAMQRADAALNATWKRVRATLRAQEADLDIDGWFDATLEGQRGWLAYRDGQCAAEGFEAYRGTMQGMLVAHCKARLTRQRIRELHELIGVTTVDYRMERHPLSGVALPRVTLPGRPAVEQAVNASLDATAADLRCFADEPSEDHEYNASVEVTYAADDVLSVAILASGFCGGAHPIVGADLSVTYDLVSGRRVGFRELFEDYDRDVEKIAAAYLSSVPEGELEGCEDVLTEGATPEEPQGPLEMYGFHYSLSAEGIAIRPAFPHAIVACAIPATVPYDRLRALAATDGLLMRLAVIP